MYSPTFLDDFYISYTDALSITLPGIVVKGFIILMTHQTCWTWGFFPSPLTTLLTLPLLLINKDTECHHYYSEIFHMTRILTLKPSMYNLFLSFYFYYYPNCTADNTLSIITQLSSHTLAITF